MSREIITSTAQGLNPRVTAAAIVRGTKVSLENALRIARTEQMRIYREVSRSQYQESGLVARYKRMATLSDRTCLGCLMADGEIYDVESAFEDHPQGRCNIIPIIEGARELTWKSGENWLTEQDSATQLRMMGPTRYTLWQDGQIALQDMKMHIEDEVWGGAWVPTPVSQLTAA